MTDMAMKREMHIEEKKGLKTADLVLAAVLIAAGAVLKLVIGMVFQGGVKPNFMIAAYCLALLLIRPKTYAQGAAYGAVIGLITGAVSQIPLLCGTPFVNLVSELVGGAVIGVLAAVPAKAGGFNVMPAVGTFVATFVSGSLFSAIVVAMKSMDAMAGLVQYGPIVVVTALCNAALVAVLIVPLRRALRKE